MNEETIKKLEELIDLKIKYCLSDLISNLVIEDQWSIENALDRIRAELLNP